MWNDHRDFSHHTARRLRILGPDLPAPDELFSLDAYSHRWPSGAEKAELIDGVLVFSGQFDDRDVRIAQSAYPGRQVVLNEDKGIEIHPASDTPPRSVLDTFVERLQTQGAAPPR